MSQIKDFKITYEALNKEGTFSAGDTISGIVAFTLTKQTKVKGLMVKARGDARVLWAESKGDYSEGYKAHIRYFRFKEYLIPETGTVLPKGVHHFKFCFKIPQGDMPSSFKGTHGKIVYMIEAKMSRSWWRPPKVQEELKFVSKSSPRLGQVMGPQSGSVDKKMGVFSKGQVQMSATVNTNVCSPGDTLTVVTKIYNSSSKKMKPKFSLQQEELYWGSGSVIMSKMCEKNLCKIVGETIAKNSQKTVSCQLKIPADVIYPFSNCGIIIVEHCLKVYLDISFAFDPEVVFPLVIVPPGFATLQPDEGVGTYPAGAAGGSSYSNFPPSAFPLGPYPVPTGSGANEYPAADPTQT